MRIADQLDRLLHQARVPRPYILVGHSLGALIVRVFAGRHRADVGELALVDSASPGDATLLPPAVRAQQRTQFAAAELCTRVTDPDRLRRFVGLDRLRYSDDPGDQRLPSRWQRVQQAERRRWINGLSASCAEGHAEYRRLPDSDREAAAVTTLGALPTAVISRELSETWAPPVPIAATEAAWHREQAALTHLSTRARWMIATPARHYIMLDPEVDVSLRLRRDRVGWVEGGACVDDPKLPVGSAALARSGRGAS